MSATDTATSRYGSKSSPQAACRRSSAATPTSEPGTEPTPVSPTRTPTPTPKRTITGSTRAGSGERSDAGDVAADDQRLDGLGALVGVDDLDVAHVTDDVVLEQDPIASEQVARLGDHAAGGPGVVELREAGDRVRQPSAL